MSTAISRAGRIYNNLKLYRISLFYYLPGLEILPLTAILVTSSHLPINSFG